MKIAITGATGFVGGHVLNSLDKEKHDIVVVGRRRPEASHPVRFIEADLLKDNLYSWISEYRPSHLIHLAWYAEHGQFWNSPLNWDWCETTERLVTAFCRQGGEQVLIAGTCAEYDWSVGYCRENDTPIQPSSTYGKAKDKARRKCQKICDDHGVPIAWARLFYSFGPGEDARRLIPSITYALLRCRGHFPVNLEFKRDFMPIQEVAVCFRHILHQGLSGIYNISSGTPIQLSDLIERIAGYLDADPAPFLNCGAKSENGHRLLVGDNTALSETGWHPGYDTWEYLQTYVAGMTESAMNCD